MPPPLKVNSTISAPKKLRQVVLPEIPVVGMKCFPLWGSILLACVFLGGMFAFTAGLFFEQSHSVEEVDCAITVVESPFANFSNESDEKRVSLRPLVSHPPPLQKLISEPALEPKMALPAVVESERGEVKSEELPQFNEFPVLEQAKKTQKRRNSKPKSKKSVAKNTRKPNKKRGKNKGAVLIKRVTPSYPRSARRAGREGKVVVKAYIDKKGRVARASVQRSSGYASLDKAALRAVRRWLFSPALKNGQAVASFRQAPVTFRLH